MGVGKTTVSHLLKKELHHSVMLDGDWCWDMHPFIVNDETKKKLDMMGMHALVEALELQEKESLYKAMTFDERLNASVDHAYQIKYNEKVKGLIRRAHFRYPQASVEDIYYSKRELDKDQIMTLITNSYIDSYKNVLIVGFTGSGNYVKLEIM